MKRVVMCSAVAGLACGTGAQNISTGLVVSLTFNRDVITIGDTATATITASWNGVPGSYLSSINVDILANYDFGSVSNVATVAWNNPALGFNGQGTASGANIIGLQASQFSLIPPFNTANPILVTTFTVTGAAEGLLIYSTRTAAGVPFPFSVTGPMISDPFVEFGHEVFQSGRLYVGLPAPGALVMLGLGGVGGRLRRR